MEVNKNSIIAISLTGAVLIAYFCVQQFVFNKKKPADVEPSATVAEQQVESEAADAATTTAAGTNTAGELTEASTEEVELLKEETYTVETNKYKVVFTNKGGDVVSLELKEHTDSKKAKVDGKDIKDCYVQMAENITDYNRAFSLNIGNNTTPIVNDYFMVKEFPEENGQKKIAFAKNYGTYTLVKQYTFTEDDYMFKLNVIVDGDEKFKGLENPSSDSDAKVAYTLRTSPAIGPYYDKTDRYESRELIVHNGAKAKRVRLSDKQYKKYDKPATWLGMGGKYFCELVVPESAGSIQNVYYSTKKENTSLANSQAYIERKAIGSEDVNDVYYIYVGPRSEKELKKFSSASTNGWKFEGHKLKDALHTSTILGWLEVAFKWLLQMINKLVKNWGVSIIIMTILLRLVLFPLTYKSSMGTLKMQEMQPKLQALQTKHKDNPQKLQEETAKLYQESGYNPLSGCLPMIFQMMALLAMFNLFNNYFEFRGASFVPGWIDDLSIGDSVWSWNKEIPVISGITGNCIRILPIIYLVSQLFYGKITQMGGAAAGQSQMNMKLMTYGLPVFFSFMFYNAPSGLILFWTISNLLQMGQQIIINKVMAKKKAEKSGNTSNLKHFSKQGKRK